MGYQLYVAGSRGSRTVCGKDFLHFGGDTSCYVITNGSYALVIDAGSGLSNAAELLKGCTKIDVVLTHVHYDHIIGLLDFDVFPKEVKPCLHGTFAEWGIDETEHKFVRKPYWPVPMRRSNLKQIAWNRGYAFGIDAPAVLDLAQMNEAQSTNACPEQAQPQQQERQSDWLVVTFFESNHPDTCSSIQVEVAGKKILFLCDYEHGNPLPEAMVQPYDIMFYDGMFTDAEYPSKRGYGHSTIEQGLALAQSMGVKQLVLSHHSPIRTDEVLFALERTVQQTLPHAKMAYTGMTFML